MLTAFLLLLAAAPERLPVITSTADYLEIETDKLKARINRKGYVSGVAAGTLLDKKTGAKDLGFGLHIMDFLMAPGWRDDGYGRNPLLHGHGPIKAGTPGPLGLRLFDLSKHYPHPIPRN